MLITKEVLLDGYSQRWGILRSVIADAFPSTVGPAFAALIITTISDMTLSGAAPVHSGVAVLIGMIVTCVSSLTPTAFQLVALAAGSALRPGIRACHLGSWITTDSNADAHSA